MDIYGEKKIGDSVASELRRRKQQRRADQNNPSVSSGSVAAVSSLPLMGVGGFTSTNDFQPSENGGTYEDNGVGRSVSSEGVSSQLRNLKKKALKAVEKVAPTPLKIGLKTADMMGIDVMKFSRIMLVVNLVLQIMFWSFIILVLGYIIVHPLDLTFGLFSEFLKSLVEEVVTAKLESI